MPGISTILITGGTGSLGQALVSYLARNWFLNKVIVLSRDEVKQADMAEKFKDFPQVKFFLGDVRDLSRLVRSFHGVDVVIHAAALKRVDKAAYDPIETKQTNVDGTLNVLEAALIIGVKKVLLISSDKACAPTNLYGASKMMAEHLTVTYNTYSIPRGLACSVVRYGNVFNSRGSVMEYWTKLYTSKLFDRQFVELPVTDGRMTRFILTLEQAVKFILNTALAQMEGGEIFIPRLPTMNLCDLVTAFGCQQKIIGLREGGEKLYETLITPEESHRAYAVELVGAPTYYSLIPSSHSWRADAYAAAITNGRPVAHAYESNSPFNILSIEDLKLLLKTQCGIDPHPGPLDKGIQIELAT